MSLGALAVLAAGCSGTEPAEPASPAEATDADSQNEAEPSADETASGPPDMDPPEVPDIHRDDDEGAQNAAEYFVELHAYIHAGGDIGAYEELSAPDCESCASVSEEVQRMRDVGEFHDGGDVEVTRSEVFPPDSENPSHLVRVYLTELPGVHRDSDGEVIENFDGGDVVVDVLMRHPGGGGHWIIEGVSANVASSEPEE
ncbi:DUF6318 family protein [Bogoriella caseilytica]|uniref:DUF6318 family protein n=1 Tax=Bogoriella caseilytica TaxID=56055 RepID=UPI0011CDD8A7|nr:DUF6318 family protein [Bogoriella caseilytica]